jgi:hypothetical protein
VTAHVYAVRYPDSLVRDDSWRCVADVIASYHGGYFTDSRNQVTGTLVRAVVGTDVWVEV